MAVSFDAAIFFASARLVAIAADACWQGDVGWNSATTLES